VTRPPTFAILIALTATTGVAWAGTKWLRAQRIGRAFESIREGQVEADVIRALGDPDRIMSPLPSHWCDSTPTTYGGAAVDGRACPKQWQYNDWPWPACFSVCFGGDGRVTSTYRYVSP
jgi:hypothetical protein